MISRILIGLLMLGQLAFGSMVELSLAWLGKIYQTQTRIDYDQMGLWSHIIFYSPISVYLAILLAAVVPGLFSIRSLNAQKPGHNLALYCSWIVAFNLLFGTIALLALSELTIMKGPLTNVIERRSDKPSPDPVKPHAPLK